jgi:hypothetical protein
MRAAGLTVHMTVFGAADEAQVPREAGNSPASAAQFCSA